MSKIPELSYVQIISALERDGWVKVRQKGNHIRLEKTDLDRFLDLL